MILADGNSLAWVSFGLLIGFVAVLFFGIRQVRRHTAALKARLKELEAKAAAGEVDSMIALAEIRDVLDPDNYVSPKRLFWLEEAAARGSALAQFKCAGAYLEKPEVASRLFLQSAEAGYEPAMEQIALRYLNGQGLLKNIGQSTEWFIKSAEKGNRASQLRVSKAYFDGFGVPQNPMEGLAWLFLAEYSGSGEAANSIKRLSQTLDNHTTLAAQNRAKQLLELCQKGESTKESASFSSLLIPSGEAGKQAKKPSSKPKSFGTATIVSSVGHVVTAAHVIKGAQFVEVLTAAGIYPATVESIDEANDLALLKIDTINDHFVKVSHSRDVRLGQSVATIGFPNIGIQGHSPKVTQGVISGEYGLQNDIRMWQISVPIQPGNSGGPLLDDSGSLIGVVVASLSLRAIQATGAIPQNVNYAIKSAYLEPMLNHHKVSFDQTPTGMTLKFEDMVEATKKCVVLILVY